MDSDRGGRGWSAVCGVRGESSQSLTRGVRRRAEVGYGSDEDVDRDGWDEDVDRDGWDEDVDRDGWDEAVDRDGRDEAVDRDG